jgi:hypothetical protein
MSTTLSTEAERIASAFQRATDGCAFADVVSAVAAFDARLLAQLPRRMRAQAAAAREAMQRQVWRDAAQGRRA